MTIISLLTVLGVSLLMGESVITPAISVLSAIEGIKVVPSLQNTPQPIILSIAFIAVEKPFVFQPIFLYFHYYPKKWSEFRMI